MASGDGDLKNLGSVMSRAVILSSGEQGDVVQPLPTFHELRDELGWRQAPDTPVLRRHDDVEAAGRTCDQAFFRQPRKSEPGSGFRYAKRGTHFLGSKMVPARGSELIYYIVCPRTPVIHGSLRINMRKISLFNIL